MATVIICDHCKKLGPIARRVETNVVQDVEDTKGKTKSKLKAQHVYELCTTCFEDYLNEFKYWSDCWMRSYEEFNQNEKEENQPVNTTE